MMTSAYDEIYLDDAMRNMGEMMDYVVNQCNIDMDVFFSMFINSGIGSLFEMGHPKYVAGCSGIELAWTVMERVGMDIDYNVEVVEYDCSPQYWCGWIMAYYQWYTKRPFYNIMEYISFGEIEQLYYVLHETSEEKCVEVISNRIKNKVSKISELQSLRRLCGYSQRILAEKSGVNLRTLQQYEIGAKNINNASFKTVMALAKALGCKVEELYEYEI